MKAFTIKRCSYLSFILVLSLCTSYLSFSQTTWYKYPGNPVIEPKTINEWDYTIIPQVVLFENDLYQMWYKGWDPAHNVAYGYATSNDGIKWEKHKENPLEFKCESVSWDARIGSFDIIKKDSLFYMWYTAWSKEESTMLIGIAWSSNGLSWTKYPEPVLKPSKDDKWDNWGYGGPQVLFDGILYHMWYTGNEGGIPVIGRVGYANSNDGIHWKKHLANPVLDLGEPGSWEDHAAEVEAVIFNGSIFEMWYHGWNLVQHELGYATSLDGIHWKKFPGNPVLSAGEIGEWDSWLTTYPAVLRQDSVCRMWYYGHDNARGRVGYATTSIVEVKAWDTIKINKPQRTIKVQIFNRTEFIKVDSIADRLSELSGIVLIDAYNKLALAYSLNDSKKSLDYAGKAMELSEQENYPQGKAMALYCSGNSQYVLDNYSTALANQLSSLRIFDSLDMIFEQANLLSQIAGIHSYTGSYDLACKYHKRALKLFEMLHDTGYLLHSLIYVGYSYLENSDTTNAVIAFKRRLNLAKEIKNTWKQVDTYEALGLCYSGRNLDSALYYFGIGNTLWDTLNASRNKAYNYMITAEAYYAAGPEYYNKSEQYFQKCYNQFGDGRQMQVRLLYGMAELYFNTGSYDETKEYLDVSLHMCRNYLTKQNHQMFSYLNEKLEYDKLLKPYMEKIYRLYYRLDTSLNSKDMAFTHFMLATQWKDSIFNQQNKRQWAMLQGEFDTETAQSQIAMLERENEVKNMKVNQSRIYLFVMGGFVIIIILMALMFIRQNKIKAQHQTVVLEQKLLRLQMNPHFIFNALSNILNFVHRKDTANAANYLTTFSRLLRSALESSREDYILVEQEISSLKNYLDLQLLRYEEKFNYSIEVDKKIDVENAIIPPMLIQPFIENAIEHGIRHKGDKGHIYIRFNLENKMVICEVEDDGVGREKAWEAEYQKRKTHKSLATKIIGERIQSLNKKLKQKINLSIIDLKSDANESIGTKVVLNIPYLMD